LGAELSGIEDEPAEGERLGCVVRDLKRLLMFLGCEEQCADIARSLGEPTVEADSVLGLLIRLIDQSWIYPDWFANEAARLKLEPVRAFKLGRGLAAVLKLLPEPCFRDDAQRKQTLEALASFNEREDETEEEGKDTPR
jgi:type III secretion system TyeA family effector delivery regulator